MTTGIVILLQVIAMLHEVSFQQGYNGNYRSHEEFSFKSIKVLLQVHLVHNFLNEYKSNSTYKKNKNSKRIDIDSLGMTTHL